MNNLDYLTLARDRIERFNVQGVQKRMTVILQAWIDVNKDRHPYDVNALRDEMIDQFGTWQADEIDRLIAQHKRRRLHRQDVDNVIGNRKYIFQIYHEKSLIADHYKVLVWAYNPHYGKPFVHNHTLPGFLTEREMRIAWPHFKRQVLAAKPEREVPFGHAGETWDFNKAWDRALNAARFFM